MEGKKKEAKKQSYAIMQDAIFEKDDKGSYQPIDMAKEGMNTLKSHSTKLTVICNESSESDMKALLDKNEITYDEVKKIDAEFESIIGGKKDFNLSGSWTGLLSNIGWELSHEKKTEDKQKKADSSFEQFFKHCIENCD